jgi:hypothetical protein
MNFSLLFIQRMRLKSTPREINFCRCAPRYPVVEAVDTVGKFVVRDGPLPIRGLTEGDFSIRQIPKEPPLIVTLKARGPIGANGASGIFSCCTGIPRVHSLRRASYHLSMLDFRNPVCRVLGHGGAQPFFLPRSCPGCCVYETKRSPQRGFLMSASISSERQHEIRPSFTGFGCEPTFTRA